MDKMKVVMMGLGYIGLPTAALISSKGINVIGVDINPDIVETINNGKVHFAEPDLEGLVNYVVKKGHLKARAKPTKANVYVIAVPTPIKDDREPDISFVKTAVEMITPYLGEGNCVIIESTCPVGTTEKMAEHIYNARPELKKKIYVAYCPERVLPGKILHELEFNDRAIGGLNRDSTMRAMHFYSQFIKGKLCKTNARTAELCKLTENAFRDTNIAFANELSLICDKLNINVWELIELANLHPRVNILEPGPGVGGHCISVDPWFIVHSAPAESKLIKTAREINDNKPSDVLKTIEKSIKKFMSPVVACLGITFKANIDDLRESPALHIVTELAKKGICSILVVEPNIKVLPKVIRSMNHVQLVSKDTAVRNADIIVALVNHKEFFEISKKNLKKKVVIDTRGLWAEKTILI